MTNEPARAPLFLCAKGMAEAEAAVQATLAGFVRYMHLDRLSPAGDLLDSAAIVRRLINAYPAASEMEVNFDCAGLTDGLTGGSGPLPDLISDQNPHPMRTLILAETDEDTALVALRRCSNISLLVLWSIHLVEPPSQLATELTLHRLRCLALLNTTDMPLVQGILSAALPTIRSIMMRTWHSNLSSVLYQHISTHHVVHLHILGRGTDAYSCLDRGACTYTAEERVIDQEIMLRAVRACPRLEHLGFACIHLDYLRLVLDAVHRPLLTLSTRIHHCRRTKGLEGPMLTDMLLTGHPALTTLRVLAARDFNHEGLRKACAERRVALQSYKGATHFADGPNRFETLFGRSGQRGDGQDGVNGVKARR
ncbi:hypothetical protein BKA62DRAFT_720981, partial [Auriculariales sp. MPI-PUGE-AT-0066]